MGYLHKYSSDCRKICAYSCECNACGDTVIYCECTCGSKVFFTPPYGGRHGCHPDDLGVDYNDRGMRAQVLIDVIEFIEKKPEKSPTCPMCETQIKESKNFKRHLKRCPKRKEWFPQ